MGMGPKAAVRSAEHANKKNGTEESVLHLLCCNSLCYIKQLTQYALFAPHSWMKASVILASGNGHGQCWRRDRITCVYVNEVYKYSAFGISALYFNYFPKRHDSKEPKVFTNQALKFFLPVNEH